MSLTNDTDSVNDWSSINLAFGKQAAHFDADDLANPVLQSWRKQIYDHVEGFLKPGDRLLEFNAGTGIDAFHFARQGYSVLATDLSTGMVQEIARKLSKNPTPHLTWKQLSFENLDQLGPVRFDYVFSNFGGLNCIRDLSLVTQHLSKILNAGAYLTWVVMPPFCPWELLWLFKGKWREAFRRFQSGGAEARLEGECFQTYYHSVSDVRKALGDSFKLVRSEGLGIFSAPPAASGFYRNYPGLYRTLRKVDGYLEERFPFNRWGDHIIVTFQYKS